MNIQAVNNKVRNIKNKSGENMDKIKNYAKRKNTRVFWKTFFITLLCCMLVIAGYFGAEYISRFVQLMF